VQNDFHPSSWKLPESMTASITNAGLPILFFN
jgi:hypothetical protein